MHKPRWILLITLLLLVVPLSSAQEISPALEIQLDDLESYTAAARQLERITPVERRFPSRADAIAEIRQMTLAELPSDESQRLSNFYIAFDLLPPGSDYVSLYLDTLEYQVAGFYDTQTETMNTLLINGGELGDELPLLEQITYVHEFTHALQDQHFDLDALEARTADNLDQSLALISLIEGDATQVMNRYTQALAEENPLGVALQLLGQGIEAGALSLPPGLPDIMSAELLGYYTNGASFVAAVYTDGGWDAIDAAYVDLPQSSEQILHPQKYLNGEGPQPVEFIAPALDPAWSVIWDTTFGEFYLRQVLLSQLERSSAIDAAAGWGGDHVQIYQNAETGALAWFMRVTWDSEADSQAFVTAWREYGDARFPESRPSGNASLLCWTDDDEALCMVAQDNGQLLAYAPTPEMAESFFTAYTE